MARPSSSNNCSEETLRVAVEDVEAFAFVAQLRFLRVGRGLFDLDVVAFLARYRRASG